MSEPKVFWKKKGFSRNKILKTNIFCPHSRSWLESNPRSFDHESSVRPLCYRGHSRIWTNLHFRFFRPNIFLNLVPLNTFICNGDGGGGAPKTLCWVTPRATAGHWNLACDNSGFIIRCCLTFEMSIQGTDRMTQIVFMEFIYVCMSVLV
jgi:hypothetical protein